MRIYSFVCTTPGIPPGGRKPEGRRVWLQLSVPRHLTGEWSAPTHLVLNTIFYFYKDRHHTSLGEIKSSAAEHFSKILKLFLLYS